MYTSNFPLINKPQRARKVLRRNQRGFSLVELLIVLVIIGILAGIAIPMYMSSTTKAKQTEAKELLHQIYLMERSHFQNNDRYWIPAAGFAASKDNPYAFDSIGVEIMKSARYTYEITGDLDHFTAMATAERLDDDPAIDKWQIDQTGELKAIIDDAITR
ncbi:MAG: prepilin-type N-terminal cleavage/methylation domain-containing protein [bacterium]|nr:prepilin-type N-terminal cleavage/methylation domain-containing protein [bacterium]